MNSADFTRSSYDAAHNLFQRFFGFDCKNDSKAVRS